jgi:hypothetical protein
MEMMFDDDDDDNDDDDDYDRVMVTIYCFYYDTYCSIA